MKICPNCKVEYDDLQNFCIQCGKKLDKDSISMEDLNERLQKMENSISKLSRPQTDQGSSGFNKELEEMRIGLIEKINHNTDALERISDRVKEMDGLSKEGKEKIRKEISSIVEEASRNVDKGIVSDLRKENQNIKKEFDLIRLEQKRLDQQIRIIKDGLEKIESNVAKSIYKELTRSLVK